VRRHRAAPSPAPGEIYAFGIAEGLATKDPAASLGAAMKEAPPATPHPALTDVRRLPRAARGVRAGAGAADHAARLALPRADGRAARFGARDALGELEDLDGSEPLWRVPPARMKLKRSKKDAAEDRYEHLVPLSAAAVDVLPRPLDA
jgi:hypothetical protein